MRYLWELFRWLEIEPLLWQLMYFELGFTCKNQRTTHEVLSNSSVFILKNIFSIRIFWVKGSVDSHLKKSAAKG